MSTEPLTPRDDRSRWNEPMTRAETDALDGVYFYDDGYAAAEDVNRLLATLDAERATATDRLDVERLARAFDKVWREDGWEPTGVSREPREEAERIAAEYALLAATATERPLDDPDVPSMFSRLIGLVLHAEQVHGCKHTVQERAALGLSATPKAGDA